MSISKLLSKHEMVLLLSLLLLINFTQISPQKSNDQWGKV